MLAFSTYMIRKKKEKGLMAKSMKRRYGLYCVCVCVCMGRSVCLIKFLCDTILCTGALYSDYHYQYRLFFVPLLLRKLVSPCVCVVTFILPLLITITNDNR